MQSKLVDRNSNGPSLETYIETRFNLLAEEINRQAKIEADRLIALDVRYQQRFDDQQLAMQTAFNNAEKLVTTSMAAADKAIQKAELASEKRFESVNEFRGTLSDQQRTLMPREESLTMHSATAEKIVDLKERMDRLVAEREGVKGGWGYAVGVIGFIATLMAFAIQYLGK